MAYYQKQDFIKAAQHFDGYYLKHPESETTLYYLYDCYQRLNQPVLSLQVLESLAKLGSLDENVYLNLFHDYGKNRRYQDRYDLVLAAAPKIQDCLDKNYILTRRLYAEFIMGACSEETRSDPMVWVVAKGYMPAFPDGNFYDQDSVTLANFIILLDRLVEPIYPPQFFHMKNIPTNSYLYIPYMRLVGLGILDFQTDLKPDDYAPLSTAAKALANLKKNHRVQFP